MDELTILSKLSEEQALGGTIYAEAAGDWRQGNSSVEERIAVGSVVRNRLANYRAFVATEATYKALCLAHSARGTYQYDCWRPSSGVNHSRLMAQMERFAEGLDTNDTVLRETVYLARGIITGVILDRTNGANFYYAPKGMVPPLSAPSWAKGKTPVATIGDQLFFKL